METNAQTVATAATEIARGTKKAISVVILGVTFNPNMKKKDGSLNPCYVLHTKPTKENPSGIYTINKEVFENQARSARFDDVDLFIDTLIGGRYQVELRFVKAGDAWLNGGNGVYNTDHFSKVPKTEKFVQSEAKLERMSEKRMEAYFAHKYSNKSSRSVSVAPAPVIEEQTDGNDIMP